MPEYARSPEQNPLHSPFCGAAGCHQPANRPMVGRGNYVAEAIASGMRAIVWQHAALRWRTLSALSALMPCPAIQNRCACSNAKSSAEPANHAANKAIANGWCGATTAARQRYGCRNITRKMARCKYGFGRLGWPCAWKTNKADGTDFAAVGNERNTIGRLE